MNFVFPENLYAEVRIEDTFTSYYYLKNDTVEQNGENNVIGAKIRVFDGKMWYTSVTNDLNSIQNEIEDGLAEEILSGKIVAGDKVSLAVADGKIVFKKRV